MEPTKPPRRAVPDLSHSGVAVARGIAYDTLALTREAVRQVLLDMDVEPLHADPLAAVPDSGQDLATSRIVWSEGHAATLTVAPDSGVSTMGDDGLQQIHAKGPDLLVATVRHVRAKPDGSTVTLSLTATREVLGPTGPEDALDVVRLVAETLEAALEPTLHMRPFRHPSGDHATLVSVVGTLSRANRLDLLDVPDEPPCTVAAWRPLSPLAPALCIVGKTAIPTTARRFREHGPQTAPTLTASASPARGPTPAYAVAVLAPATSIASLRDLDPVSRLRLLRDAKTGRTSAGRDR